jgi:O-antigen chain-terminating methyltransferase
MTPPTVADPEPPPQGRDASPAARGPLEAGSLRVEDFRGTPTRSLAAWQELWASDLRFPIESHRGPLGRLVVWFKRLLRPLVTVPQADLWDRQRSFNLILLEVLLDEQARVEHEVALLHEHQRQLQARVEAFLGQGLDEVMRYNDALFFRVDQKLDRARREAAEQTSLLRAALATPIGDEQTRRRRELLAESRYAALEDRYRGERGDIQSRVERYLPELTGRAPVLDLGCGRGEALEALRQRGVAARGVDRSAEMVRRCRERGLDATHADLVETLAAQEAGSLGAVVSFHVVEHLAAGEVDALVDLAWRALRPGGLLLLETPNPQSLVAGAARFWIDPTHRRPVHPERLRSLLLTAGFEVEIRPCAPFPDADRLPEVAVPPTASEEQARLVFEINALRDRLDDLLFGWQDYAALGVKPP